jgi:hypothetical protein
MGITRTRWTLATLVSTCAMLIVFGLAASAQAFHVPGAAYNGSVIGGGTIQFSVSPDGSSVSGLQINNVQGNFCTFIFAQDPNPTPIVNHAFGKPSGSFSYSGSFPSKQSAQGTLSVTSATGSGCTTGPRSWTANTSSPATGTQECIGAQSAVDAAQKKVADAKKKVKKAEGRKERKRAKKKLKQAQAELDAALAQQAASC